MKRLSVRVFATTAIGLFVIAQAVSAATFTWNGTTSGNWSVGSNWVGGIGPTGTNNTDVLVFNPQKNQAGGLTVTTTHNIAVGGNPGSDFLLNTLTLNGSNVNNSTTMSVNLNPDGVNSGNLTFTAGGTINMIASTSSSNRDIRYNVNLPVEMLGDLNFAGDTTGDVVFSFNAPISGTGALIKTGTSLMALNDTDSTVQTTSIAIRQGGIQIFENQLINNGATVTLGDSSSNTSGRIIIGASTQKTQTLAGLLTAGAGTANRVIGGDNNPSILILNIAANTTNTYDGLFGSGTADNANDNRLQLTKNGDGTLILTNGASTHGINGSGNPALSTTVNAGTLLMNNPSGSAGGQGNVVVNSGGTLGGTGSTSGNVTVNSGGALAPGASAGSLEIGSLFTLQDDATLAIELGGTSFTLNSVEQYDRVKVTGLTTLAADSLLDVSLESGFDLDYGQMFGILDAVGGLSGMFAGLNEGDTIGNFNGFDLFITYQGDITDTSVALTGGNDVVLFTEALVIPEPATATVWLGLGVFALLGYRRCRSRRRA